MGCSTSTQTSAVDPTRPSHKPEDSNGASTTGAVNENGNVPEDSETIPDPTPAQSSNLKSADEPAAADATCRDTTQAASPTGEEPQPTVEAGTPVEAPAAEDPAAEDPSAEAPSAAADNSTETAVSSSESAAAVPEQGNKETTATESEPRREEAPEKATTTAAESEAKTEEEPASSE